jgi:hypothetical protein
MGGYYQINNGTSYTNTYSPTTAALSCGVNGIVNIVELNVQNLQRWLYGTIGNSPATSGSTGQLVESTSQNGYIFYYSDRRGMNPDPLAPSYPANAGGTVSRITGGYGFEDLLNPSSSVGAPNGTLDTWTSTNQWGEDSNMNGRLDTFGVSNTSNTPYRGFSGTPFPSTGTPDPFQPVACGASGYSLNPAVAAKNKVTAARHALRLVNASEGNLPANLVAASGSTPAYYAGGFTVASENPVYVMGAYNATFPSTSSTSGFGDPSCAVNYLTSGCNVAAAVMADAVTLLSGQWSDRSSFNFPNNASQRVTPAATSYRLAIIQGNNPSAPYSSFSGMTDIQFGTDG